MKTLPKKYGAYEVLARYYLTQKEPEKAITLMDNYISQNETEPDRLKALVFKAAVLVQMQKADESLKILEAVLKENPGDVAAHTLKGDILTNRKDYIGAITEYRTVLNENPNNSIVTMQLARAHILNGETALAEDLLGKALQNRPQDVPVRLFLADLLRRQGKLDRAKEQFEEILALSPDQKQALAYLGDMALARKDAAGAEKYWGRLVEMEPESPMANFKIALAYLLNNKWDQAEASLEKALELDPDFSPALEQLLNIKMAQNKVDEALARCKKQVELRPKTMPYILCWAESTRLKRTWTQPGPVLKKPLSWNRTACRI